MSAALRIDLGQPVPFRRTPEFLFGDTRRRARRLGGAAGGLLAVAVVAAWWATAGHTVRHEPGALTRAVTGTDPVAALRPTAPAEPFPLIPEPQARALPWEREGPPLPLVAPHIEEITPAERVPRTVVEPMVQPRQEEPLLSLPLLAEEPSLSASSLAPGPALQSGVPARKFIRTVPSAPWTIAPEEAFPWIAEPQVSAVARAREDLRPPMAALPREEITPAKPTPGAVAAVMAQPPGEEPLRSLPAVEEGPSPLAASAVEPAPSPESSAPAAVTGDAAPAGGRLTPGKAGSVAKPERHYLQVGTYRLEESIATDQRRCQALGLSTIIQREGGYYVLRLLPFPTREEAEQEEARLQQMGIDTLYIPPPAPQP